MLFLAVFCGFLAEYKLEHVIEDQREKEYMRTMMEDLKSDSAMFETNIQLRTSRIKMIDSLVTLLSSPVMDKSGNDIYFFARSISPPVNIFPNDRTIQQEITLKTPRNNVSIFFSGYANGGVLPWSDF